MSDTRDFLDALARYSKAKAKNDHTPDIEGAERAAETALKRIILKTFNEEFKNSL